MNPNLIPRISSVLPVAFLCIAAVSSSVAAVTVDGNFNTGDETEYSLLENQVHSPAWGNGNHVSNIQSAVTGKILNLFVGGRANGNGIIIFIDSKAGGVSTITNDLIRSGGFESDINNLAPDSGTGMTFESGFQPDLAIRVYGSNSEAYASHFDLQRRIRIDLGRVDNATATRGPVSAMRVNWADYPGLASDVTNGIEMALNMALLGVPEGSQNVKVLAMLVNSSSTFGSNQTLGSLGTNQTMDGGLRGFDFGTASGTQTLTIPVVRPALVTGDDEDGDGITNGLDPFPLDPTRDIQFSVNMSVEAAKGFFNPATSNVQVLFVTGSPDPLSTLTLIDPDEDLVYTGVLENVKGFQGDSFGTYKFITNDPQNTNSGFEFGLDRSFNLGAPETSQIIAPEGTVYFSNDSVMPNSYTAWAAANASGQGGSADTDGDGVPNGVEYFMGATGNGFTSGPVASGSLISWTKGVNYPGVYGTNYMLQTSATLSAWEDVLSTDPRLGNGSPLQYSMPEGEGKIFVRLKVITP
jgi:hypothetical protein